MYINIRGFRGVYSSDRVQKDGAILSAYPAMSVAILLAWKGIKQ